MAGQDSKHAATISAPTQPDAAGRVERRRNARYPFVAAAEVIELRTQARMSARSTDLGLGGCYVDTMSPFAADTAVMLRLTHGSRAFEAQATVIYVHAGMGMGLAFTRISSDQLAVLQEWVGALSGETTPAVDAPETDGAGEHIRRNERHVLNQLISLMIRKGILSATEGDLLLRELFR